MNLVNITHPPNREEVIDEIIQWGRLDPSDVLSRWKLEESQLGYNVNNDVTQFRVTPHVYNEAMERLYREGFGFIFETLCYWMRPDRLAWSSRGLKRLQIYATQRGIRPKGLRILMLGDGTANDTIYLWHHGYRPAYFDIPGSQTFSFAQHRLKSRHIESDVRLITDYKSLLKREYDVIWCFDVIEHLPDLPASVHDMGRMLKSGGAALITESCRHVRDDLPTHLRINEKYDGKIVDLMRSAGLWLHGYEPDTDFRPTEYRKLPWHAFKEKRQSLQTQINT